MDELQHCLDACTVQEITGGHVVQFQGFSGSCCATDGPSTWTEEMAKKAAVFFWALHQKQEAERAR